jgi:hypothetical protein
MKFSEFKNNSEILAYFGLVVHSKKFIYFQTIPSVKISPYLKKDLLFVLAERGDTDTEFYTCEALIFPILKEAWKQNPKVKLFSHPQIRYEDLILVPDYVVTPKDKTGINTFQKPLLITVEAKHDDYDLGWADAYCQLIVARFLNENNDIPIYAVVSIGKGWEFGLLEGKIIYKHPIGIGLDNPNKLFGVLDFIFANCVRTAEKFNMY